MLVKIDIKKADGNAGMEITTDEGLVVTWNDLDQEDQVILINTLNGFTRLFGEAYLREHSEELAEQLDMEASEEDTDQEVPDVEPEVTEEDA